jgi:hypothetical protein
MKVPDDAFSIVKRLDPEAIARRLDELDREQAALRVLARAARAARATDGRAEADARPKGAANG